MKYSVFYRTENNHSAVNMRHIHLRGLFQNSPSFERASRLIGQAAKVYVLLLIVL